eukprot:g15301.t1
MIDGSVGNEARVITEHCGTTDCCSITEYCAIMKQLSITFPRDLSVLPPARLYPFAPAQGILNLRGQTRAWLDVDSDYCRTIELKKLLLAKSDRGAGLTGDENGRPDAPTAVHSQDPALLEAACVEAFLCILAAVEEQFPSLLDVSWPPREDVAVDDDENNEGGCPPTEKNAELSQLPLVIRNRATGDVHVVPEYSGQDSSFGSPPLKRGLLRLAALLLQEDFVLLLPHSVTAGGREDLTEAKPPNRAATTETGTGGKSVVYVMAAHAVCFPDHWDPEEKMGKSVDQIRAYVPHYSKAIAAAVNGFLQNKLSPQDAGPYIRFNYTFQEGGNLLVADPHTPPPASGDDDAELYLRVERQGFRKLRRSGGVLFSIRTYLSAVREVPGDVVDPFLVDALSGKSRTTLSEDQRLAFGARVLRQIAESGSREGVGPRSAYEHGRNLSFVRGLETTRTGQKNEEDRRFTKKVNT